jgi:hypothetical protein
MRKKLLSALLVVLSGSPALAVAQVREGPEFQVNTVTNDYQVDADVAADPNGEFVVAWVTLALQSPHTRLGSFGRRFDNLGVALDPVEIRIDSYAAGTHTAMGPLEVAATGGGSFVALWDSLPGDGDSAGIFGRRFDGEGAPVGPEFVVNTYTTAWQVGPAVASDPTGRFVVVWTSYGQDGSNTGIVGRRYDASGAPLGGDFQVNSYWTGSQYGPGVAMDANGGFVVTWHGSISPDMGIRAQRFDASGNRRGDEFRVDTNTAELPLGHAIASAADGRFVVTWDAGDGYAFGIFARLYDASGAPRGAEFAVNASTLGHDRGAMVAMDAKGNFVVAWQVVGTGDASDDIRARHFDASGAPQGPEFTVNAYTTGQQRPGAVASSATGRFVVGWDSPGQNGPASIFGQRFAPDLVFKDGFQ